MESLISFVILIDSRLRERLSLKERLRKPPVRLPLSFVVPPMPPSSPMPPGTELFSEDEPMHRVSLRMREPLGGGRDCGQAGHFLKSCPTRPGNARILRSCHGQTLGGVVSSPVMQKDKPLVLVTLSWCESSIEIQALMDSGATGLFIDAAFVSQHSIPLQLRDTPLAIEALDGRPLQPAHVTHETVPLSMAVGALHLEIIQFQVISSPRFPLVIGYPWLQRHNPSFDWPRAEVLSWSPQCSETWFLKVSKVLYTASLPSLPEEYHDFGNVFDKGQAGSLPPHQPYDCAIDLQPGAIPPRGRVYPLSVLEDKAMEEYVAGLTCLWISL
ncbi:protein orai-2 isoform X1 [Lithobates pipiens]